MSMVENLSQNSEDKDVSSEAYRKNNEYLSTSDFDEFKDACQKTDTFPDALLKDMDKMYDTCIRSKNVSNDLSNLIKEGIENIRPKDKKSFDYVVKVYNKLLQLGNNDTSSSTIDNCVPNTSKNENLVGMVSRNGNCFISHKLFDELIEKCYDNVKFPKSNIDKIRTLFKSIPSDFTESKLFIKLLTEANQSVWPDSSEESYVHLDNIYGQLRQFKSAKKRQDQSPTPENKKKNAKLNEKIRKLKEALKITRKKIKEIDEMEMSVSKSDDFDKNSPYILKDKYERRALEIYKRLCHLTKNPDFLEQPLIRFKGTDNMLVNKTIEKYYNTQKQFPDYHEVYVLLESLNIKKNLNWSENELSNISRDAFFKLGKQLKLIRVNDYMSRISEMITEKDPAEENEELKIKLEESNKQMDLSINRLVKEFELKQNEREETDCSSRGHTECENSSSDEEFNNKLENKSRTFNKIKNIEIKRKRSPNLDDNEETHSKCSKKLNVASIDLKPCEKKSILSDKFVLQNLKTSSVNEKTEDSIKGIDNSKNDDKNNQKQLNNSIVEEIGTTEEKYVGLKNNSNTDVQTISDESVGDLIINESEVVSQELSKNEDKVIEIIEHDDSGSDLEMTVCDMPNLSVIRRRNQMDTNNKSNFNKKNNWLGNVQNEVKDIMPKMSRSPQMYRSTSNIQIPSNSKEGYNQWLKNTGAAPQNGLSTKFLSPKVGLPYSRPQMIHTNMQQRQVKQHIVQQQHHKVYNQVTRMTTTTTVVEQSAHQISYRLPTPHMHRARHVLPRNRQINKSPELIELD